MASCQLPSSCIDLVLPDKGLGTSGAVAVSKAIHLHPRLERIFMQKNKLGPRAAVALVAAMEALEGVKVVHLDGNKIGNEGAEAFATLLSSNHPLEELSINGNDINDVGGTALAEALRYNSHLQSLHYFQNDDISEAVKEDLRRVMSPKDLEARKRRDEKEAQKNLPAEEVMKQAVEKYKKAEQKQKEVQEQIENAAHMNTVATEAAREAVAAKNKFLEEVQQCKERTESLTARFQAATLRADYSDDQRRAAELARSTVAKQRDVAIAVLVCALALIAHMAVSRKDPDAAAAEAAARRVANNNE